MKFLKLSLFVLIVGATIFLIVQKMATHPRSALTKKVFSNPFKPADTILLVSLDFTDEYLLPKLTSKITSYYHIPVKHVKSHLPAMAWYPARQRYRADSLIRFLAPMKGDQYRFVVGICSKDISTTDGPHADWGVFGLGTYNNTGCITSTFRLKRNASQQLLQERIEKVVMHEIGHNLGLTHCDSPYSCNMKDAKGTISSVDNNGMLLCKECLSKLSL